MSTVSITSEVAPVEKWDRPDRLREGERAECRGERRTERVAARVLAKVLAARALELEPDEAREALVCRHDERGAPFLELRGPARRAANGASWDRVHVSWSHTETFVSAAVWAVDGTESSPAAHEVKQREFSDR